MQQRRETQGDEFVPPIGALLARDEPGGAPSGQQTTVMDNTAERSNAPRPSMTLYDAESDVVRLARTACGWLQRLLAGARNVGSRWIEWVRRRWLSPMPTSKVLAVGGILTGFLALAFFAYLLILILPILVGLILASAFVAALNHNNRSLPWR